MESVIDLEVIKNLISIGESNKELNEAEKSLNNKITKELPELFQFLRFFYYGFRFNKGISEEDRH